MLASGALPVCDKHARMYVAVYLCVRVFVCCEVFACNVVSACMLACILAVVA